jgi:hypothetical protein
MKNPEMKVDIAMELFHTSVEKVNTRVEKVDTGVEIFHTFVEKVDRFSKWCQLTYIDQCLSRPCKPRSDSLISCRFFEFI